MNILKHINPVVLINGVTNLNGQILAQRSIKATRYAAIFCGIGEGHGAQDVMQQVAGQTVALLTAQPQGQLEDLHQLCTVWQQLLSIHTGHLDKK